VATELLSVDQLLANTAEPKRTFRWIISINGIDAYTALSSQRPGDGAFAEQEIPFINSRRYIAGRWTFGEWKLELWDPIAPSAAQKIQDWIRLAFEVQTGRAGYADIYKKDFEVKLLDPPGGVAEKWQVKGAWIKTVDYGALAYNTEDLVKISLSFRYDQAILLY